MQPPESTIKRSVSGYLLVISSDNQGSPHREPSRFNHIKCWTMKMLVWVAHRGAGSRKEWINRLLVYHDHATETLHIYLWVCRVFFELNKNLTLRFKAYIRKILFWSILDMLAFSSNRRPQSRLDWGESLVTPPRAVSTRRRKSLEASGPTPQQKRPSSRQRRTNRAKEWRG